MRKVHTKATSLVPKGLEQFLAASLLLPSGLEGKHLRQALLEFHQSNNHS